jgi:DNA-binding NarL/FixJ family response regulator
MAINNIKKGRRSILTDEQRQSITKLASEGLNYYKIGKQLGINKGTVHYYLAKTGQLNNK